MLDASDLYQTIKKSGIFAEVPNSPVEDAVKRVTALWKGVIPMIEVDHRPKEGVRIVEECASRFKGRLVISANFVLKRSRIPIRIQH